MKKTCKSLTAFVLVACLMAALAIPALAVEITNEKVIVDKASAPSTGWNGAIVGLVDKDNNPEGWDFDTSWLQPGMVLNIYHTYDGEWSTYFFINADWGEYNMADANDVPVQVLDDGTLLVQFTYETLNEAYKGVTGKEISEVSYLTIGGNCAAETAITVTKVSVSGLSDWGDSAAEEPADTTSPKTGDNSLVFVAIALLLLAAPVAVVVTKKAKVK